MGFIFNQYAKGIYIDDHERDNIVAYQKEFFETMTKYIFIFLYYIFNLIFYFITFFIL